MRKKLNLTIAAFALCCGLAKTEVNADLVNFSLTSYASVSDASGGNYAEDDQFLPNGGSLTAMATIPGFSSTTSSYFSATALSATFDQVRGAGPGDNSFSTGQTYHQFYAGADDSYNASATFSNSDGFNELTSYLYDWSIREFLFWGQEFNQGPGTAVLGSETGNAGADFSGSLTGSLVSGHFYEWSSLVRNMNGHGDSGSFGSGNSTFNINAVPEPATFGLVFSGLIGWLGLRPRRHPLAFSTSTIERV